MIKTFLCQNLHVLTTQIQVVTTCGDPKVFTDTKTIFKHCPEEEYLIIFLSIIYYRSGVPLDNGKEPGGAAGGDGEGWKAILRKRRE